MTILTERIGRVVIAKDAAQEIVFFGKLAVLAATGAVRRAEEASLSEGISFKRHAFHA